MKPSQTTGEAISNIAANFIGLEPNREQMNLSRQMSPYLSMEPLLKMRSEMSDMDYRSAMAEHARAMADYYRQGAKAQFQRPEIKQDESGAYYKMNPDGSAMPVTQHVTSSYRIPDMQVGGAMLPGREDSVSSDLPLSGPLPGAGRGAGGTAIERLVNGMEQERVANGGQPFTAQERADAYTHIAGTITGAQTGGRYGNTPGFMGQADEAGMRAELNPIDAQLDRLNKLDGADLIAENAMASANHQPPVADRITALTNQRNQILNKYIPRNGGYGVPAGPSAPGPTMDIPQPVVSPAMDQRGPAPASTQSANLGGIPVPGAPGAVAYGMTSQQAAQAVRPAPQPKAAGPAAAKPSPAKPKSGRPKVSIAPDGTIHVE
jgi:hypothetical protein